MLQTRYSIGTTPSLIAGHNPHRKTLSIEMLPITIESGNTGKVFIGYGRPPTTTVGDPSQGDVMTESDRLVDKKNYDADTSVFSGDVWAAASASGQIIMVNET